MALSPLPSSRPDFKSAAALEGERKTLAPTNQRVEGFRSSKALVSKLIEECDRNFNPNRYRRWSVKWITSHLSLTLGKVWDRLIALLERVGVTWIRVFKERRGGSPAWKMMEQREELRGKQEALERSQRLACVVAQKAEQGVPISPHLEALPEALQSKVLSFLAPQDQSHMIAASRTLSQLSPVVEHLVISADQLLSTGQIFAQTRFLCIYLEGRPLDIASWIDKIKSSFKNVRYLQISEHRPDLSLPDTMQFNDKSTHEGLGLSCVVLDQVVYPGVLKAIAKHSPQLTSVRIYKSKVEDQDLLALSQYCKSLEKLDFDNSIKTKQSLGLEAVMRQCTRLNGLRMRGGNVQAVLSALDGATAQLSNLYLHCPPSRLPSLEALVERCKGQKQLKRFIFIDPFIRFSDMGLMRVAQVWPQLQELTLLTKYPEGDPQRITDQGLESLAKGCCDLGYLMLDRVDFAERSAAHFPQLRLLKHEDDLLELGTAERASPYPFLPRL